ncbi:MAG TPA: glycosyl hydrolase [Bryobacteraceae bacterium]|nr:glycosyl hydrolase [Bryobacteraceae bacterium]
MRFRRVLLAAPAAALFSLVFFAQQTPDNPLRDLRFRLIGPFRGGRAVAAAGVPSDPKTFYFGATGGGVWKTSDAGLSWRPISDGFFKTGSVGAIAVADSDPNTIYVGMGEACVRGNASNGDGVYKSTDGGRSWRNVGLEQTYHIGAVVVHPTNPDIVYVAALGHLWGPNPERGVYRSTDGGQTWKQVLTRGNEAGAVDLVMDPSNPRVLYASFWQISRKPWRMDSGGPGSGLWKSTDGGDTWQDLSHAPGMPRGVEGRIGISVSAANPERVYALVEASDGGVYRSDNGGRNWTRQNSENDLRQRAWYYSHIYADPKNPDLVYVLNVGMFSSADGGRTFRPMNPPHGDNHDLWIAPTDPNRMILANDGGATITLDGGHLWSTVDNQPTAQFYRVALDEDFPYHAYGAQQDNSTVRIATRTTTGAITDRDWYDVGGGESGWIAPDPRNSEIAYAGSYGNLITRQDHRTGQVRNINPWPDNPMGYGADTLKYRFQWSFPIAFSPHDPKTLYVGSNVLMKTTNEGQNWENISPDLTRNDKTKQASSGGPITQDNTSIEYFDTIFTFQESPITKDLIWVGTDDGLVQLTRDGGKHWTNVTPPGMPDWIQINSIDASTFDPGTAYVAATAYKLDDFRPFLFKTTDYGKTWTKIVNGIPDRHFTRVVKEDPNHRGLLVAGTEFGLYISFDDGANWKSFQQNLPIVPIADVAFQKREKELVIATQGRAFWVMDDLPLLYQLMGGAPTEDAHLFQPKDAYRLGGGRGGRGGGGAVGENPPSGVVVQYSLKSRPQGEVKLEFLDSTGKLVHEYSSKAPEAPAESPTVAAEENPFRAQAAPRVPAAPGMNRFVWNMRYPDATTFPGLIMWAGSVVGPIAAPGKYEVRLTVDGKPQTQSFNIMKDPRLSTTPEDYARQISLALQIRDKLAATNDAVIRIRAVRQQLEEFAKRDDKRVADAAKALSTKLTAVEEDLYQTKNRAAEDPLNFPIKLNNKLAYVMGSVESSDNPPTAQENMVYEDVATKVNAELKTLDNLMTVDLAAFNKLVHDAGVPAVAAPGSKH